MEHFVIVGGGTAAHQAARSIVEMRVDARVSIVRPECQTPYSRPHLSKAFLTEGVEPMYLSGADMYGDPRVTTIDGANVVDIDRHNARASLESGGTVPYDKLIIATGSRVRRLPESIAQEPVHYLRTLEDAISLRSRLVDGSDVVVIGGGFIGLEVAAAARQRNCKVTVLEAQPNVLARTGCPTLSEWIFNLHVSRGVAILPGTQVERISRIASGRVVLDTSEGKMTADIVIVGIGVVPNDELARRCGLDVENGIVVDPRCATQDPNIFAAGEVTRYPVAHLGIHTRSESWMAASEQGTVAGRAAAGDASAAYAEMPWLWSDQFGSNIQCLGFPEIASKRTLIGDSASNQWVLLGWDEKDRLVNAIAANSGRDISAIKRAIKRGTPLPPQYTSAMPVAAL
ncbi:pyridine nucleotide-disulfide oxidoreductase [Burkholderia sp. SFA1]|uniref:NAD(P)/FAD-dependent oxidoreductase n=1 Tax=unclassified Caballeronia TaxID=2646786 RepID=UPI001F24C25D|nr:MULTISPECIES: FAD-dependent oxidoreductase [unclassified Caballeronia]MCE4543970.1 FAD-dependent oxidoreductase [Caballeronia sp. PC1]MCE4571121.1 FAD-dependent oxidoreductase [Caballeronia sp. CLC5]BBP98962.1 pyridine nucleotide-disulfide oxidoreductase [Burkholderia sp. SFA1]